MQETSIIPPHSGEPRAELGLLRMRLRLALLAVGVVPLVGASALLYAISPGPLPMPFLTIFPVLGLFLLPIVLWLPRHVLRTTEALDRSRTEMRRLYESARADALRDGLTGLGNHRGFQEELDRQLEWYSRYKVPVALLLIDLDDLKLVNDVDGHAAGDELLRDFGRLVAASGRYADRAFRIGGDEFAVLMPHTDVEGALQIARRLQERAAQRPGRSISFSGGISACPTQATSRAQLYAQADAALYWCKRHGRSSIDVFHPVRDRPASLEASDELSAAIARVVSERLLRPVYQPIVDLATGRVIGFEGLIRPTPESGFTDPGSMFVAAETVGRTVELDHACISAVVAGARNMSADQLLTVNISPRTVEAPHFSAESLLVVLARHGIDPGRVVVELTEREKVEDGTRLQANLTALQRARVRIAADDVGAGNAGLRLLSQIRFDIVKIDLTLVQEGAERDSSRAVLRSLRDLASRWGASVIAEGLETVSQLRTVRELDIAAGQGYLLGRPMADTSLTYVDLAMIEAGGQVLERRPQPAAGPLAAPTA
ncbi:MAG: bifunctional diguanylate cyclase/phosphodiesterase [Chloroflexota bacterium]